MIGHIGCEVSSVENDIDLEQDSLLLSETQMERLSDDMELNINHLTEAVLRTTWHIKGGHQHDQRLLKLPKVVQGMPKMSMSQDIEVLVMHASKNCVIGKA